MVLRALFISESEVSVMAVCLLCSPSYTAMRSKNCSKSMPVIKVAADTVPHQRLLKKLYNYGIRSNTLKWLSTWLTQRSQRVLVDGQQSEFVPVQSGVPQGTVLGPSCF